MVPRSIKSRLASFFRNEAGNVTLVFGLMAVPLVAAVGLAVDVGRIMEAKSVMRSVADGAALAAAAADGTDDEREVIGAAFIEKNKPDLYGVTATSSVEVDGENVSVNLDTVVQGTLMAVIFNGASSGTQSGTSSDVSLPDVSFVTAAAAESGEDDGTYHCVIALNSSMADAIYIRGTGDFTADDCTVHSDSSDDTDSIHLQGSAIATADAFTAVGGWEQTGGAGEFSVEPEGGQSVAGDPFDLEIDTSASSSSSGGCHSGSTNSKTIKKQNGNVSLSDTTYSDVTIQTQGQATFTAGTHYITGTLSIGSQATLNGTGVTIVLVGDDAKITMSSGAIVKLSAPTSGDYVGFAVVGDASASTVNTNTIQGGASSYITGIWYTPKHKLYVTGNGSFNLSSDYFPVIADNIEIGGNGEFHVGFDWETYGYPEPTELYHANSSPARLTN